MFVFASKIEYSPLVLFEAAASGLPFLTTPVGNAREIAGWTQCGRICPSVPDREGYIQVDPAVLASEIDDLINHEGVRLEMARLGRTNWQRYFTWDTLISDYEKVLMGQTLPFAGRGVSDGD